jgi:hypothetical protein
VKTTGNCSPQTETDYVEAADDLRQVLIQVKVDSVVPTRARHIIRRFLKNAGYRRVDVTHVQRDMNGLNLQVTGRCLNPTAEQIAKVLALDGVIHLALNQSKSQASRLNVEGLRESLVKFDPTMSRIWYSPSDNNPTWVKARQVKVEVPPKRERK